MKRVELIAQLPLTITAATTERSLTSKCSEHSPGSSAASRPWPGIAQLWCPADTPQAQRAQPYLKPRDSLGKPPWSCSALAAAKPRAASFFDDSKSRAPQCPLAHVQAAGQLSMLQSTWVQDQSDLYPLPTTQPKPYTLKPLPPAFAFRDFRGTGVAKTLL